MNSQTAQLAHVLMDRIGPRLAGTPGLAAAQDWLVELYGSWGVSARKEQYGTWNGWRAGMLHVDMVEPRLQTLEAELLEWSPASSGMVEGEVVMPPEGLTEQTARQWLATVRGKFVLMSAPSAPALLWLVRQPDPRHPPQDCHPRAGLGVSHGSRARAALPPGSPPPLGGAAAPDL